MGYSLNFKKFANDWLPNILKATILLPQLAKLLVNQLTSVNDDFVDYAAQQLQEANYTNQTISIEWVLNNRYNLLSASRKIYIDNTGLRYPRRFGFFGADKQVKSFTGWFGADGEDPNFTGYFHADYANEIDFTVMIPVEITYTEDEVKAIVSLYKVAGRRFNVTTYA